MPAMASPSGDDAPQNPQNAPPQAGGQQGPPGQAAGGQVGQMIQSIGGALQHLQTIIGQDKQTTPQEKQMIGQILEEYGQLVQSLGGAGQPQGQGQGAGQGQTSPMEVGGNANAQPSQV